MTIQNLETLIISIFIIAVIGLFFIFFTKQGKFNTIITFIMNIFITSIGILLAISCILAFIFMLPSGSKTNAPIGILLSIIGIALSITGILLFILKKSSIFITKIFILFSFIIFISILYL